MPGEEAEQLLSQLYPPEEAKRLAKLMRESKTKDRALSVLGAYACLVPPAAPLGHPDNAVCTLAAFEVAGGEPDVFVPVVPGLLVRILGLAAPFQNLVQLDLGAGSSCLVSPAVAEQLLKRSNELRQQLVAGGLDLAAALAGRRGELDARLAALAGEGIADVTLELLAGVERRPAQPAADDPGLYQREGI